ncbi:MAG: nitroreductase family protein [bacterium]|nr:nitroreductase family protein [bacterium]
MERETYPLAAAIANRRSVRQFESTPVPDEHLRILLEAAISAPSAGNRQPWRFIVVRNPGLRLQLAQAAGGQSSVATAPVAIVVLADLARTESRYGQRGTELYALQDTAAAIENLLLTAVSLGYATCWVGAFDEGQAARSLELPPGLRPVAIVPVGVPAGQPRSPDRRPLAEVVDYRD